MVKNDEDLISSEYLQELPIELLESYFPTEFNEEKTAAVTKFSYNTQRLLLKIFYNFTKVTADKIDNLINLTLKGICEIYEADRCNIFRISEDGTKVMRTYTWRRDDLDSVISNPEIGSKEIFPWGFTKLEKLETIILNSLKEMSAEMEQERDFLQSYGIKSIVSVPISFQRIFIGFISLDSICKEKAWSEEIVIVLNILADIFGSAFKRKEHVVELEKLESYYNTVFENTGLPAFIIDEDLRVLQSSRNWEGMFGYPRGELEGMSWVRCLPKEELARVKHYHYSRRKANNAAPHKYTVHVIDKMGRMRDCMVTVALIPGTKNSVVTLSDITQYNRIGRALKVTTAITTAQIHAVDEKALLDEVCQKIVDIGRYRFAWFGYIGKDAAESIMPVAHAGFEEGYLQFVRVGYKHTSENDVFIVQHNCQPTVCRNIEADLSFPPWKEEALKRGYKAVLYMPLFLGGEPEKAVLAIYSGEEDVFDDEEVALIKETVDDLVFGIKYLRNRLARAKTAKQLAISLQQTDNLLLEIVDALAASVEAKDPYTAGHQKRVGILSGAIASKMGLGSTDVKGITIAGTIHDIGKIQIPGEILCKPGKLLKEEFGLIKTHSQAGYDIIKNIDFLYPVAEILLQHHERLDGSGYPKGLREEEILLGAKIVAVADVVEAISSYRPYRPALGIDKALEEIERLEGIQFDRQVVEACLSLFRNEGFKLFEN